MRRTSALCKALFLALMAIATCAEANLQAAPAEDAVTEVEIDLASAEEATEEVLPYCAGAEAPEEPAVTVKLSGKALKKGSDHLLCAHPRLQDSEGRELLLRLVRAEIKEDEVERRCKRLRGQFSKPGQNGFRNRPLNHFGTQRSPLTAFKFIRPSNNP